MSEKQKSLELLAKGKVTELEGIDLLKESEKAGNDGKRPSWLHIRVKDMAAGKNKVSVNIPMRHCALWLGHWPSL